MSTLVVSTPYGAALNTIHKVSVSTDAAHPAGQGILGLGPNSGSEVFQQFNSEAGDATLDRIFRQNTSTPNYITILLGRTFDTDVTFPGEITVGHVVSEYQNITSQPKLSVARDQDSDNQHYQVLVDKNGIIGPDGNPIQAQSVVQGLDQLIAVLDSGFSLPQVPACVASSRTAIDTRSDGSNCSAVSNAIYSRVPGANFTNMKNVGNVWTLPCDVELNVTFKFEGVSFPINPLDTNLGTLTTKDANGDTVCAGAFQPITSAASPDYDMILGMAFCAF